jgi:hypothetical protein
MARRALNPVKLAYDGEEYDVVPCPWDGSPAPVFQDRRGQPFAKCMTCGGYFFGNMMALTVAKNEGRARVVVWPARDYKGGTPVGGELSHG